MPLLEINALGLSEREFERVSYLATLEEIPLRKVDSLSMAKAPSREQETFVVARVDTPAALRCLMEGKTPSQRFVVLTEKRDILFSSDEEFNAFFDRGGICLLQNGWSDASFRSLVAQAALTNSHFDDLELPHVTLTTLFLPGRPPLCGYTGTLRRNGMSAFLMCNEAPRFSNVEFSLSLSPGMAMHGRCDLRGKPQPFQPGVWRCEAKFLEFDGVSRPMLYTFLNDGLSHQPNLREESRKTNGEYLAFLRELTTPVLEPLGLQLKTMPGVFEQSYGAAQHVWLTNLLLQWILRILNEPAIRGQIGFIQVQLKETPSGRLALYLVLPIENRLTLQMNDHDILEGSSLIRSVLDSDQLALVHIHGLRLEQYVEEKFEHLAICLEER